MAPITPEIISRLIFAIATLRYFEQQHQADLIKDSKIEEAIANEKNNIDRILHTIDCTDYKSLQTIYEQIINDQLKQAI